MRKKTKVFLPGLGWCDYQQNGDNHLFTRDGEETDIPMSSSISDDKKVITMTPEINHNTLFVHIEDFKPSPNEVHSH